MPTKKAFAPNQVAPKRMKKPSRTSDSTMLMLDSHLMPLPTPDSAESVDAPMMKRSATTMPKVLTVPAMLSPAASTASVA